MTWDERLNKAFDYIEDHLASDIDLDKVASIMCQSKESFLRTFSFITNISLYDYIRKRRMTLAAIDLLNGSDKVIEVAMKYGYESPEAFTRAFKAIHGISPSAARKKKVKLNLYPRISFLLTVKGEVEMEYQVDVNQEEVNWSGLNWEAIKVPDLKPVDICIYLAEKWREEGRLNLLDLGAGLGRHAIYFSKQGFQVSAMDISDYAIEHLKKWAEMEKLTINAEVGDMQSLPYPDQSFDCIFAYHVISHTDTAGLKKTISEIERVLRPNGEVYLSFCSKESTEFAEKSFPLLDKNTLISQDELEKGIPHFYADLNDLKEILANFQVDLIKHTEYFFDFNEKNRREKFYYVNARLKEKA